MFRHRVENPHLSLLLVSLAIVALQLPLECSAQGGQPLPVNGITINITEFRHDVLVGGRVSINASYMSTPRPTFIIWLKDGLPLLHLPILPGQGVWIECLPLVIGNATCQNGGQYTLFINNTMGHHFSRPVDVYVTTPECRPNTSNTHCLYPPSCSRRSPSVITVCEQRSVTLEVTVGANPPVSFVDWMVNGVPINRSDTRYEGGDAVNPSLTISPIDRGDAGTYELVANNSIGLLTGACSNCSTVIQVEWSPEVNCTCSLSGCVVVNETDTIVFPVDVAANPAISYFEWYKENIRIDNSTGRFIYGNAVGPSLSVLNSRREDTGTYSIYMNNTCAALRPCDCCSTVQYPPVISCGGNQSVCIGTSVTLVCESVSVPAISAVIWRQNGLQVDVSSPRYSGGTVTSPSLTIFPIIAGDEGLYQCQVTNLLGSATCPVSLGVFTKPEVTVQIRSIILIEGQTSSIGCSVDMRVAPPPVVVQWFKDAILINTSSGRYDHGNIDVPSLTIRDIRREDAGLYSCGAINAVGDNQSDTINVVVQYPPVIEVKYTNYGVPTGINITLWCSVDANPPVPNVNVTWIRDGAFVLPSTYCTDIRPSMKLCNVETDTAGTYLCRATNILAARQSAQIDVRVRAECLVNVTNVRLIDGPSPGNGRLEVPMDGTWGTVCGKYWTQRATQVVCSMLGFGGTTARSGMYGAGTGPIHIGHVNCGQGATTLSQCGLTSISNCSHEQDIWVDCNPVNTVPPVPDVSTTPVITVGTTAVETTSTSTTSTTSTTTPTPCPAATETITDLNLTVTVALSIALGLSLLANLFFICHRWCFISCSKRCSSTHFCEASCCVSGKEGDGKGNAEKKGNNSCFSCISTCCNDSENEEKSRCIACCYRRCGSSSSSSSSSDNDKSSCESGGREKKKKKHKHDKKAQSIGLEISDHRKKDSEKKQKSGNLYAGQSGKSGRHRSHKDSVNENIKLQVKKGCPEGIDQPLNINPSDKLLLIPDSNPPVSSNYPGDHNERNHPQIDTVRLEENTTKASSDSSSQSANRVRRMRRRNGYPADEDMERAIEGHVSRSGDRRSRSGGSSSHRQRHRHRYRETDDSEGQEARRLPGEAHVQNEMPYESQGRDDIFDRTTMYV